MWCFVRLLCALRAQRDCHTISTIFTFAQWHCRNTENWMTEHWAHEDTWTFSWILSKHLFHHFSVYFFAHRERGGAERKGATKSQVTFGRRDDFILDVLPRFCYVHYCYYDVSGRTRRSHRTLPSYCTPWPLHHLVSFFAISILNVRMNGYAMPRNLVIFS